MDLRCNLRSCGKLLEGKVWVTSCHHIFCDKDGQLAFLDSHREPLAHRCCPVCETPVNPTNYGVLRKELDPTMEFRAIMLVGLKPDIIAETVAKAMEFWLHQAEFEKKLQAQSMVKMRDETAKLEANHKEVISKLNLEANILKRKLEESFNDIKEMKAKYFVLNEKYSEKCRSNQKLQTLCDTLQRNEPSAKIESIPSDVVTFIEASEKENIFNNSINERDGSFFLSPDGNIYDKLNAFSTPTPFDTQFQSGDSDREVFTQARTQFF